MTQADRRTAVGLFVVVFVAYAWFFGGGGWNQNANFDLTRALVEQRTIAIDAYATNTGDVSKYGGHVYSNKPPGLAFLTAIPYAALYAIEAAQGVDLRDPLLLIINQWLLTVAVCATSGALLSATIFLYARMRIGATPLVAASIALLIAFGTYLFAWSTVFFMHVPNALLLFLAFVLAREKPLAAGACAGAATLCNYVSAPAALVLLVLAGRRGAPRFILGSAPFAVVLMVYHTIAFGSPFRTSVEYTNPNFLEEKALFGVMQLPNPEVLLEILIGRYRGLFYLSPVLLFAIAGAIVMVRRRFMRTELIAIGTIVAVFLLFNAGFNGWHGGAGIGPRYVLPIVPLLAIPMLFATALWRPLWIVLGAVSIAVNFLVTAVNPMPSKLVRDPIGQYTIPLFMKGRLDVPREPLWSWKVMVGHVSVNAHAVDELHPFTRHAPGSAPARWASFNLGETFAPGSRASLIPVLLWMLIGSAAILRGAARGERERGSPAAE